MVRAPLGTLGQAGRYGNMAPLRVAARAAGPGECHTLLPSEEPFLSLAHQPRKRGAWQRPPGAWAQARAQGGLSSQFQKGVPRRPRRYSHSGGARCPRCQASAPPRLPGMAAVPLAERGAV